MLVFLRAQFWVLLFSCLHRNVVIYTVDTTRYSKCDGTCDLWLSLSWFLNRNLTYETLGWGRKWAPYCHLCMLSKLQKQVYREVLVLHLFVLFDLINKMFLRFLEVFFPCIALKMFIWIGWIGYSSFFCRFARFSNNLHNFSVTNPRIYEHVYVNIFFSLTAKLLFLFGQQNVFLWLMIYMVFHQVSFRTSTKSWETKRLPWHKKWSFILRIACCFDTFAFKWLFFLMWKHKFWGAFW